MAYLIQLIILQTLSKTAYLSDGLPFRFDLKIICFYFRFNDDKLDFQGICWWLKFIQTLYTVFSLEWHI